MNTLSMKKTQQGFTLIELMIVVAIIGILAAVAIPSYQDYTARAQVTEALESVSGAKAAIAEYGVNNGAYPAATGTSPTTTELAITGVYGKAAVTEKTGVITYTFGAAGTANANIAAKKITFTPPDLSGLGNGALTWACASTDLPQKYLPKSCTSTSTSTSTGAGAGAGAGA